MIYGEYSILNRPAQISHRISDTLQPCLRVEGQARLNLYTDPVNGFSDVPLISREWYCQNVGLVKFEREERVPSGFIMGGMVSAEVLP